MAVKATIYKCELQISDMDRHYYQAHTLTLAQHPSETEERLMVRLLAFALHASESLAFGKGISTDDEPDLWDRDLTGVIDLWIDIGQPDEQRIRKACGRARKVVLLTYSGRSADIWWDKISDAVERCKNLSVFDLSQDQVQALVALANRNMKLQVFVQDGQVQVMDDVTTVTIELATRRDPANS
ncbi:YaeQ family protein [Arenimonas oryziterrae]|uniref:YaeQ family protein n=1 Tax=Arenimonas oryziterrae DSM 21050 = YC6267 TaxID=1121015 RepID=A0A091B1S4_9GAMM|nr:YaeQ family protein [Arenimonas oryziterrae]KFN44859.1 hypothetical protein N789_02250 [Arenimonas oryziterrae DSM 21050 = YC6267]